tara:strand:+ start:96 stop:431 length:336 start_codon:yes stop_codon:yes gene_type:complete
MSKIIEFITDGALIGGVRNWVWLAGLAIIAAIAFVVIEIADNRDKRMVETAQESGATGAIVDGQNQTLDQIGKANEGRNEITGGRSAADYEQCLLDSAPGYESSCERFKPL